MMMRITLFLFLALLLGGGSCSDDDQHAILPQGNRSGNPNPSGGGTDSGHTASNWLIPQDDVFHGGPGKDGIPSIDAPAFTPATEVQFLQPNDLVLGVQVGGVIKAYPHRILDWHEIVNDEIDGLPLAITYCPLTGTGIGWHRMVEDTVTTFGVSGLLYHSNLIPYDRATDSHWSQMLLQSVQGPRRGLEVATYPVIETRWSTWLEHFPNSLVMNRQSGFNRNYDEYPYGNYRTDHDFLLFPVSPDDRRLPRKDRGLGVILEEETRFYPLNKFTGPEPVVVQETRSGVDLVVVGHRNANYLVAYRRQLEDGTTLSFRPVKGAAGVVMEDQEGNRWNLFGLAVTGPRAGQRLTPTKSYMGFWFAWGAFYPGLSIY